MSQSLSHIFLHIIFSTKNRKSYIDSKIEPELYAYLTSTLASCGSYLHKIGGMEDHLHIFATLPRTLSTSDFLSHIKTSTSKWIKTKDIKYHDFSWQKGFAAYSVSPSNYDSVVNYIANQKEHHKKKSFQNEYREFLHLHKVPFDERYVWD